MQLAIINGHSNTYQNIKHPVVKNLVKLYAKNSRLEIEHKSDLPARSGMDPHLLLL